MSYCSATLFFGVDCQSQARFSGPILGLHDNPLLSRVSLQLHIFAHVLVRMSAPLHRRSVEKWDFLTFLYTDKNYYGFTMGVALDPTSLNIGRFDRT